ncbi:alpha/beta-hydrolase [Hypoxylon sp. FL1150]|nr:alpha/beta-hydrolase [Hypoxylon sp. FL1150]
MPTPSILFIPGSFAPAEFYDNIVNAVTAKGHEMKALHYPSIGLKTGPQREGPPTMYDDAAFIANEISRLSDDGKEVMLVAHSYGGIPATESLRGLTKDERQKQGKPGGVVRVAYMTVLLPAVGSSAADMLGNTPDENRVKFEFDEKGWMHFADIPAAAKIIISDLADKEEREAITRRLTSHSAVSFSNELTHAGYRDVPVSYLFCEADKCIPPQIQREGIEMIERDGGKKVDVTSINAGHIPNVTVPQEVTDWILREVEKHATL